MDPRISRVWLENFQCIRGPAVIEMAPVTFLYGPNSSGKSAIADAIDAVSKLCNQNGHPGTKHVHMRDPAAKMVLGIGMQDGFASFFAVADVVSDRNLLGAFKDLDECLGESEPDVDVLFTCVGDSVERLEVRVAGELLAARMAAEQAGRYVINTAHPFFARVDSGLLKCRGHTFARACSELFAPNNIEVEGDNIELKYRHDCFGNAAITDKHQLWDELYLPFNPRGHRAHDQTTVEVVLHYLLYGFVDTAGRLATAVTELGPLRCVPTESELMYPLVRGSRFFFHPRMRERDTDLMALAEPGWYDGRAAWQWLAEINELPIGEQDENSAAGGADAVERVNEWLDARLGLNVRVSRDLRKVEQTAVSRPSARFPEYLAALSLRTTSHDVEVGVGDVGSGVAQVVPILAAGFYFTHVFLQQPELHLHPRLQGELTDFFISRSRMGRVEWIIETHSEHMALRALRRVRETSRARIRHRELTLMPEDVAFYYFDQRDGVTSIKRLRVDEDGEFIDRWPKGFFTEREEDLFDDDL